MRPRLCRPRPRAAVQTGQGASANSPSSPQEREMKVTARGHLAAFLALQSLGGAHRKEKAGERTGLERTAGEQVWLGRQS